ncbi:MAG: homocysteine S-methyltransferase family protein [Candidatus Marinimicrobia bacterium]|nr:homocysteine S-methyltransferase family protein [Candidatus Neomarinimicrobiota bacterium]MBT3676351.1 homocysteine S-methyltransferase family protein [Candidatus Neomarinimicrobiota bacterium]MBT3763077.1 homocysteine S-methyltransferase family protein [Candidatus Neomarinimicrobiota bacterium]MBT4067099.1 homocysteine S-methyltransferase family protein [Candidatus Neomarinimicrobiota bacterium]MBT4270458.1 homocysteine S-methyltransferase family protein [Candidatus Neomarinimicrobiota bact
MNKPLIMDGAMGTELMARGLKLPLPLWSAEANLMDSEIVSAVHRDYVSAGADILGTNTFRTTTWSYRKADYSPMRASERAKSSLMKAVELARSANPKVVVGSITSIEDCYEPESFPGRGAAEDTYGENVEWFNEAGVNVILFETMGHLDEIEVALNSVNNMKIWLSLIVKDGDHLLSGHPLESLYELAKDKVDVLMLNCNTIGKTDQTLKNMIDNWSGDWGVYPNLGLSEPEPDGEIEEKVDDISFNNVISKYLEMNPMIIGSCCGSTPKHTEMIYKLINQA